jgi:hypothetical protein
MFEDVEVVTREAIEAELQAWGLPYTYVPEFRLSRIDLQATRQLRQAGGVDHPDPARFARYCLLLASGSTPPPIVLNVIGGAITIADGMRRTAAALHVGRRTLPAYVVEGVGGAIKEAVAATKRNLAGLRALGVEPPAEGEDLLRRLERFVEDSTSLPYQLPPRLGSRG